MAVIMVYLGPSLRPTAPKKNVRKELQVQIDRTAQHMDR
jgi:hypothetical protein